MNQRQYDIVQLVIDQQLADLVEEMEEDWYGERRDDYAERDASETERETEPTEERSIQGLPNPTEEPARARPKAAGEEARPREKAVNYYGPPK